MKVAYFIGSFTKNSNMTHFYTSFCIEKGSLSPEGHFCDPFQMHTSLSFVLDPADSFINGLDFQEIFRKDLIHIGTKFCIL